MITPEDTKKIERYDLDEIEAKIDKSIKEWHGRFPWEEAIIEGELPVDIRNEIAQRYKANGWNYVYHKTSSENGERPGLTSFVLSTKELDPKYTTSYHKI